MGGGFKQEDALERERGQVGVREWQCFRFVWNRRGRDKYRNVVSSIVHTGLHRHVFRRQEPAGPLHDVPQVSGSVVLLLAHLQEGAKGAEELILCKEWPYDAVWGW